MSQHTVAVEFDKSMHPSVDYDSLDEPSKIAFAVLDTSYKLLREYAVRVAFSSLREQLAEQGQPLKYTDEELFKLARESGVEGAPTSYMDLAPEVDMAARGLHGAFRLLVETATEEIVEGLDLGDVDG